LYKFTKLFTCTLDYISWKKASISHRLYASMLAPCVCWGTNLKVVLIVTKKNIIFLLFLVMVVFTEEYFLYHSKLLHIV
jgi:hypothetical protein